MGWSLFRGPSEWWVSSWFPAEVTKERAPSQKTPPCRACVRPLSFKLDHKPMEVQLDAVAATFCSPLGERQAAKP